MLTRCDRRARPHRGSSRRVRLRMRPRSCSSRRTDRSGRGAASLSWRSAWRLSMAHSSRPSTWLVIPPSTYGTTWSTSHPEAGTSQPDGCRQCRSRAPPPPGARRRRSYAGATPTPRWSVGRTGPSPASPTRSTATAAPVSRPAVGELAQVVRPVVADQHREERLRAPTSGRVGRPCRHLDERGGPPLRRRPSGPSALVRQVLVAFGRVSSSRKIRPPIGSSTASTTTCPCHVVDACSTDRSSGPGSWSACCDQYAITLAASAKRSVAQCSTSIASAVGEARRTGGPPEHVEVVQRQPPGNDRRRRPSGMATRWRRARAPPSPCSPTCASRGPTGRRTSAGVVRPHPLSCQRVNSRPVAAPSRARYAAAPSRARPAGRRPPPSRRARPTRR